MFFRIFHLQFNFYLNVNYRNYDSVSKSQDY